MGLPALEFSDCYLDSPQFRERLKSHELELEKTNKFIKELIKDGKALIQALKNLSAAKRKFAQSLNEYKFQCIGDAETDDEMCIAKSLQEFAAVLKNMEDERSRMVENASEVLITPLEKFRKEQIGAAKEAKKKYDKETEKYCGTLEKHLSLSSKKKETQLLEADTQVDQVRQHFYEVSLEYVFKVQEVQERKMFEFVEPLLAFLQGLFTYYHHGYDLAKDFSHFKTNLTISIQNTRDRFESTRAEVESLMKKMKESPHEHKSVRPQTMEGYLFMLEKRSFVSTWVKYYCTYHREPKRVSMVLYDQKTGGRVGEEDSFILKCCTRRKTESIEKRFCFDLEAADRPGVITMQALSEDDRKLWMEAMDGLEPVGGLKEKHLPQLDHTGFSVIKKFIHAVETRGIDEQGLYRIVGVNSRVQKLLSLAMDPKTCADVELDTPEWEIKTITSSLKHYLSRTGPTPFLKLETELTAGYFPLAELDNPESRILEIQSMVHHLPEKNRQMLELLMKHLANVALHHEHNLMTVANLGVVFGPTLLRPQEETVAAIMDLKFQNIVVEILIENHDRIFSEPPVQGPGQLQANTARRKSSESKAPSCSERPLTFFHTSQPPEKSKGGGVSSADDVIQPARSPSPRRPHLLFLFLPLSPTSPSPSPQCSPSWPMFSAPSSPQPAPSIPDDSSPVSPRLQKARALYACKAEHQSELSFTAGAIFEDVHPSREPGWLEGTFDGRTGLIPENYVEFF
uniref:Rho GTPase activating protein 26 n=1 Tax=Paramormyrops kingsleyae TaxID=1676925 RepID=A0A3B3QV92_9TELE